MYKKIKITTENKLNWVLVLTSPFIWKIICNIENVALEWLKFPLYLWDRIDGTFSEEKLVNMGLMRWAQIEDVHAIMYSKLLYNKLTILIGELFDLLTYYSPRLYFQSGDGSIFSPQGVEPIPVVFFPLFVFGFVVIVKKKRFKLILLYFISGLLPWLVGVKSFSYLFPLTIVILYFIGIGFKEIKNKYKQAYLNAAILYGLFLLGRMVYLI